MLCALYRILRGPRAQDRVIGFDSLYVNAMLLLIVFEWLGKHAVFQAALLIALLDSSARWRSPPAARRGDRMSGRRMSPCSQGFDGGSADLRIPVARSALGLLRFQTF